MSVLLKVLAPIVVLISLISWHTVNYTASTVPTRTGAAGNVVLSPVLVTHF